MLFRSRANTSAIRSLQSGVKRAESLARNGSNGNRNSIIKLRQQVEAITKKWNEQNGNDSRAQRVLMRVAQILPGLKAHSFLTAPALDVVVKAFKRLVSESTGTFTPVAAPVLTTFDATSPATIVTSFEELRDALEEVRDSHNQQMAIIYKLRSILADDDVAEAIEAIETAVGDDTIAQFARLAPSQWEDKQGAMYEVLAKYIGGKTPNGSGTLLGGIL